MFRKERWLRKGGKFHLSWLLSHGVINRGNVFPARSSIRYLCNDLFDCKTAEVGFGQRRPWSNERFALKSLMIPNEASLAQMSIETTQPIARETNSDFEEPDVFNTNILEEDSISLSYSRLTTITEEQISSHVTISDSEPNSNKTKSKEDAVMTKETIDLDINADENELSNVDLTLNQARIDKSVKISALFDTNDNKTKSKEDLNIPKVTSDLNVNADEKESANDDLLASNTNATTSDASTNQSIIERLVEEAVKRDEAVTIDDRSDHESNNTVEEMRRLEQSSRFCASNEFRCHLQEDQVSSPILPSGKRHVMIESRSSIHDSPFIPDISLVTTEVDLGAKKIFNDYRRFRAIINCYREAEILAEQESKIKSAEKTNESDPETFIPNVDFENDHTADKITSVGLDDITKETSNTTSNERFASKRKSSDIDCASVKLVRVDSDPETFIPNVDFKNDHTVDKLTSVGLDDITKETSNMTSNERCASKRKSSDIERVSVRLVRVDIEHHMQDDDNSESVNKDANIDSNVTDDIEPKLEQRANKRKRYRKRVESAFKKPKINLSNRTEYFTRSKKLLQSTEQSSIEDVRKIPSNISEHLETTFDFQNKSATDNKTSSPIYSRVASPILEEHISPFGDINEISPASYAIEANISSDDSSSLCVEDVGSSNLKGKANRHSNLTDGVSSRVELLALRNCVIKKQRLDRFFFVEANLLLDSSGENDVTQETITDDEESSFESCKRPTIYLQRTSTPINEMNPEPLEERRESIIPCDNFD